MVPISDSNLGLSAYFLGKLQGAVYILTTHPGDAKTRLRGMWTPFCLAGAGVPTHLSKEYKAIMRELTARCYPPDEYELAWEHSEDFYVTDTGWVKKDSPYGRMVYTTQKILNHHPRARKPTAAMLAERILTLSLMWKEWLDERRKHDVAVALRHEHVITHEQWAEVVSIIEGLGLVEEANAARRAAALEHEHFGGESAI